MPYDYHPYMEVSDITFSERRKILHWHSLFVECIRHTYSITTNNTAPWQPLQCIAIFMDINLDFYQAKNIANQAMSTVGETLCPCTVWMF